MSASERLRALGREVAMKELGKPGVGQLIDALPEIVAVVKAAEATVPVPALIRTLRAALVALDEKLEGRAKVDTNEKARRLGYDSLDSYLQDLYDGDGLDEKLGGGK